MKTLKIVSVSILCSALLNAIAYHAPGTGLLTPSQEFETIANKMLDDKHGWDNGEGSSESLGLPYDQLKTLAYQIMSQPDHAQVMLTLLAKYKSHDGYPRQRLINAIIFSGKLDANDVPFLKDALLLTTQFHYDKAPRHANWLSSENTPDKLADGILNMTGRGSLMDQDAALLHSDPVGWLKKYMP